MKTKDMKISIEIIKKRKLTKELEFNIPKTKKNWKTSKNGAPGPSPSIYKRKGDIYKLILGFQLCQVTRVRSIALVHSFPALMVASALDRTICALEHTYFRIGQILWNMNLYIFVLAFQWYQDHSNWSSTTLNMAILVGLIGYESSLDSNLLRMLPELS